MYTREKSAFRVRRVRTSYCNKYNMSEARVASVYARGGKRSLDEPAARIINCRRRCAVNSAATTVSPVVEERAHQWRSRARPPTRPFKRPLRTRQTVRPRYADQSGPSRGDTAYRAAADNCHSETPPSPGCVCCVYSVLLRLSSVRRFVFRDYTGKTIIFIYSLRFCSCYSIERSTRRIF